MCMGVPQEIIKIDGMKAAVKYKERIKEVAMLESRYEIGDYVYIQADVIIDKVPRENVEDIMKTLEMIK